MIDKPVSGLTRLQDLVSQTGFILRAKTFDEAIKNRDSIATKLQEQILPRCQNLDSPLSVVIGGSTGAGKSTLLNSILESNICYSSVLRPTTRRPLLAHNPNDELWFADKRVLASFERIRVAGDEVATPPQGITSSNELEIRSLSTVIPGLAFIDSPDFDSVSLENRIIARQLFALADMWIFVTTPTRYADAAAWHLLREAAKRNVPIAIVLNRVPANAFYQVRQDLIKHLSTIGLVNIPVFVFGQYESHDGLLISSQDIAPLRQWLANIGSDPFTRTSFARQSLLGAINELLQQTHELVHSLEYHDNALNQKINSIDSTLKSQEKKLDKFFNSVYFNGNNISFSPNSTQQILQNTDSVSRLSNSKENVTRQTKILVEALTIKINNFITDTYNQVIKILDSTPSIEKNNLQMLLENKDEQLVHLTNDLENWYKNIRIEIDNLAPEDFAETRPKALERTLIIKSIVSLSASCEDIETNGDYKQSINNYSLAFGTNFHYLNNAKNELKTLIYKVFFICKENILATLPNIKSNREEIIMNTKNELKFLEEEWT